MEWEYDYAGRAIYMDVNSGALTLAYDYDGDGRLQYLYRRGLRSSFLLDGRNVLREWVPITIVSPVTSVALRPRDLVRMPAAAYAHKLFDYTHGLGLISEKVTTLTTGLPSVTHFYRWDGRSTTGRLEDPNRNIVNTSVYDAYGLLRNPVTQVSAYGFVGEEGVRGERDQPPSLGVPYHMRARMYDPVTGRFTSRDPVWDVNLYEYGKGNPWSYVDPDGQDIGLSKAEDPEGVYERILRKHDFQEFKLVRKNMILRDIRLLNDETGQRLGDEYHHNSRNSALSRFWADLFLAESLDSADPDRRAIAYQAMLWERSRRDRAIGNKRGMKGWWTNENWDKLSVPMFIFSDKGLERAQRELELGGVVPGPPGWVASIVAAIIALARGQIADAAVDMLALIPFEKLFFGIWNGYKNLRRAKQLVTRTDPALLKQIRKVMASPKFKRRLEDLGLHSTKILTRLYQTIAKYAREGKIVRAGLVPMASKDIFSVIPHDAVIRHELTHLVDNIISLTRGLGEGLMEREAAKTVTRAETWMTEYHAYYVTHGNKVLAAMEAELNSYIHAHPDHCLRAFLMIFIHQFYDLYYHHKKWYPLEADENDSSTDDR